MFICNDTFYRIIKVLFMLCRAAKEKLMHFRFGG